MHESSWNELIHMKKAILLSLFKTSAQPPWIFKAHLKSFKTKALPSERTCIWKHKTSGKSTKLESILDELELHAWHLIATHTCDSNGIGKQAVKHFCETQHVHFLSCRMFFLWNQSTKSHSFSKEWTQQQNDHHKKITPVLWMCHSLHLIERRNNEQFSQTMQKTMSFCFVHQSAKKTADLSKKWGANAFFGGAS